MNRETRFTKIPMLFLGLVVGLAAVLASLGLFGMTSAALAQEPQLLELIGHANLEPMMNPLPKLVHSVVFTDPALQVVQDLAGNDVGQAVHIGGVKCKGDNCSKRTKLDLLISSGQVEYEYRFNDLQAFEPEEKRLVVAGRGIMQSSSQRERFLFAAIFQDNGDGTVHVTYTASRPDASFVLPSSPGKFEFGSNP